ncbi:Trans-resveratrol di-O-methyltransferase [Dichanthelium oligosanthes]|uniref:Trans-resveratrol di-O-methyltransferase n=1 Tax=Dichanthelium oligosanthes TaxID=888268 RepID=A0A1E5VNB7_9POAL|nr:Trans-resveratrol di-O-methyltransferase [Dichanthelium oligosanthes]
MAPMTSTGDDLMQAEAELWCHAFGYLKSIALQCAIKLGIPNAIHRCGGAASLSELHAALPVAASKGPCLSRLMRFLTASGVFGEEETPAPADGDAAGSCYRLTAVSRLLVVPDDDNAGSGHTCLSQLIRLTMSPFHFKACQSLAEWLQEEDGTEAETTPLTMAHGASLYDIVGGDVEFGSCFNEAMGSDSRFVAEILFRDCGEVFTGVTSLVDVGGGDGTMARAIAKAFPHMRCSVLELPHVTEAVPVDDTVEFVPGDMMEFVPPADAVLLKV